MFSRLVFEPLGPLEATEADTIPVALGVLLFPIVCQAEYRTRSPGVGGSNPSPPSRALFQVRNPPFGAVFVFRTPHPAQTCRQASSPLGGYGHLAAA